MGDKWKSKGQQMLKEIIKTVDAPEAIGPYSQAVRAGDLLFVSGQIALEPVTGELVNGDVQTQTRRVMDNLRGIIEAAGASLSAIVKCTIYLSNIDDFVVVNDVYAGYFSDAPPARATVEVSGLPKGVAVEIDAIVYLA